MESLYPIPPGYCINSQRRDGFPRQTLFLIKVLEKAENQIITEDDVQKKFSTF